MALAEQAVRGPSAGLTLMKPIIRSAAPVIAPVFKQALALLPAFVVLVSTLTYPLWADQLTLKNDDRISGTIVRFDGKKVVLKSEFAGEVTIPWDAVTGVVSSTPLNVGLKGGQMLVGTVNSSGTTITVKTADAGTITAPRDTVEFIRSKDDQAAYQAEVDRYRNPRLVDLWTGFLDLGFAQSRGNAETQTFNLSANAARATTRDKISTYFTSIYSTGRITGSNVTTANAKRGGISYNLNLTRKWFAFGSVDIENDQFQSLDLRFVPAGGMGYHVIANPRTTFDLQTGATMNREFFSTGLDRTRAEILLGETFNHKFTERASFQERLFYYPGVSDSSNRINFDLSFITAIRRWFNWQLTFSDRFLSDPVPGFKKNDTLFTTGARLTFAK